MEIGLMDETADRHLQRSLRAVGKVHTVVMLLGLNARERHLIFGRSARLR